MNKTQTDERSVIFEVIPGGLFDDDDIPAPDKPIEEWTDEEHEEYLRTIWNEAGTGTMEHVIKSIDLPKGEIITAINVLEAIRVGCAADASASGLRSEWNNNLDAPHLQLALKLRLETETGIRVPTKDFNLR